MCTQQLSAVRKVKGMGTLPTSYGNVVRESRLSCRMTLMSHFYDIIYYQYTLLSLKMIPDGNR